MSGVCVAMDGAVEEAYAPGPPVTLRPLSKETLPHLRDLNRAIFPVAYTNAYYQDLLSTPAELVRLAYAGAKLVGAVCCRVEEIPDYKSESSEDCEEPGPAPASAAETIVKLNAAARTGAAPRLRPPAAAAAASPPSAKMYIMTLGVLATYRERGVGSQLLRHALDTATRPPVAANVEEVYLHVQVGNDAALSFYMRHGFEVKKRLVNYYRKLDPADCYYVRKRRARSGEGTDAY